MKRLFSLFLALTLTILAGLIVCPAASADGEVQIVEIKSAADLELLRADPSAHAVLTSDLTISSSTWTPIGDASAPFSGSFHGCGYTITLDLEVNNTTDSGLPAAIFGYVSGSVRCLNVEGTIDATVYKASVAPIAAYLINGGVVADCRSSVDVTVNASNITAIGGIVGTVAADSDASSVDGVIIRCKNAGTISATLTDISSESNGTRGSLGGILGFSATQSQAVLTQCVNEGTINVNGARYNVGGIVGQTSSTNNATNIEITECANLGEITMINNKGERAAGIIGYIKLGKIEYSYNLGQLSSYSDNGSSTKTNVFGIFGYANIAASNRFTVRYCYSYTPTALGAEICNVKRADRGVFLNYYLSGRTGYSQGDNYTNSNIPGTEYTFTDAADLTTKLLSAASGKYVENTGSYPKLAFEDGARFNTPFSGTFWTTAGTPTFTTGRSKVGVCPICAQSELIPATPATVGWHTKALTEFADNDSTVTLIGTISDANVELDSADELHVTVAFSTGGQIVKNKETTFATVCSTVRGCASTDLSTARAQNTEFVGAGYIFAVRVVHIPNAVYNVHVTVDALLDGNVVSHAEADYNDLFIDDNPRDLGLGDLPKYAADSVVSPVYNAGPGLESDQYGTTETDCLETVVSQTNAADYAAFLADMTAAGFTQVFSNTVEGNEYRAFTKNGETYYLSYASSAGVLRIVADKASTGVVTDLAGGAGSVEPVIYQYALDFTKNNKQTSGDDYWAIDCGMCYIIHLADNSLFLIDGGHMRQSSDAALDALNEYLHDITNTPAGGTVRIAGWFFSHPHGDHVYLTHAFLEKFHAQYDLEAVFCNFPSYQGSFAGNYDGGTFKMKNTVNTYYPECDFYKLHTGQTFSLPGVDFDVIYTHEDAVRAGSGTTSFTDCNNASTVIRATINGKSVMFLGDINTAAQSVILSNFTTATLKSDAVQMAHHCINNVPNVYNAVAAPLLLCPQSQENVELNSSKTTNLNNAINAAGASYRTVLYAADYNYKLSFSGAEIAYETAGEIYSSALYFEKPSSLDTYTGAETAESPVDASLLSGLTDLSDYVVAKSARGTSGTGAGEAPQCLFDGNTGTKWCETTTSSPYVMFRTKVPVTVSAYELFAANDTGSYPERNPKCWTLWGSADGENWAAIDQVYDGQMNTGSYSGSVYAAGAYVAGCSYFVLVIHSTVNGTTLQLSELQLFGAVS